jgi:hypothetical protein
MQFVIAGLDLAIHRQKKRFRKRWMRGSSPRMTVEFAADA